MRNLIFSGILFLTLFSCNQSDKSTFIQYGAYHWTSSLDSYEIKACIEETPIRNYYIRFFDLKWNTIIGAYPEAKLYDSYRRFKEIVNLENSDKSKRAIISPVVYLTLDVLQNADSISLHELASNTIKQINFTLNELEIKKVKELQIDCDWTESTKDKYFYFLNEIREYWKQPISVTVKMYQYKYREKAGIPPADKAVLMCYNLQSPKDFKVKNSIFSLEEFKKYMNRHDYPLPLDFAIPAFSWVRVFVNGEFEGVMNNWYMSDFESDSNYKQIEPNRFLVINDHTSFGHYWRKGTIIISESIDSSDWAKMIQEFKPYYNQDTTTLITYQLNEQKFEEFKKYSAAADSLARVSK